MQHSALPGIRLRTDLSVSVNDILGGGERGQTHRTARVQLLGRNADLRAEAELKAVGKARRRIDIDSRRVHFLKEALRSVVVAGASPVTNKESKLSTASQRFTLSARYAAAGITSVVPCQCKYEEKM